MPFPILRTPFVVLSEIISLLEPNEIVTVSYCSSNVTRILKGHFRQRKSLEWRLFMTDRDFCGKVDIETSKNGKRINVLSAKHSSLLNGNQFMFSSKCPVLYFEDLRLGTEMIVNYVTDLFNLDVFAVVVDRYGIWAINWINNRQETILGGIELSPDSKHPWNADDTVDYVFRHVRFSHYCKIDVNVSDNFQFNGKLGPMKELNMRSCGHWVTLNNLMNFDVMKIVVPRSRLSVSDLNSFLRHWRAGGSPRLEWLHLNFEEHSFTERFDEDLEVVKTNERRVFRSSIDGMEWVFNGGYSIQRTDGVKAMIERASRWFVMTVWH
ncbi:unnamed protein product [Caenorhabditis nigoni]